MATFRIRVTFYVYSSVLKREFRNVEVHRSIGDARLRASALGWQVERVEPAEEHHTTEGVKYV